ncbi:zinc transport system substrate-binding protein [Dethiosulfatibacter aminovorans DSM 17477]|uniref:Zinc transport system substrate-binding protein n=1 Tax=Dethiosulfatibacter aminovorans DSM 17477 TaxID=1121476 RepID=A0A1M6C993_9FIRM|nr:zinc ABC transporter substrate-binding protein [Dethiosulfatibacter aminovorans]SHI57597.1 zinc transport system substrate-binding protein [Dethiosulfatibacter aminovorans DSM 17477]
MKKMILLCAAVMLSMILISCSGDNPADESEEIQGIKVAVSIVPQERFVREVGGDLVDVVAMIPAGASPANYQPTPKHMQKLSEADLYFSIGVASERANIIPKIYDLNEDIKLVSLEKKVAEVYPMLMMDNHEHEGEIHDEDIEEADPHIWLSPRRVTLMVETIRDSFVEIDPKNSDVYMENAEEYIRKLEALDARFREAFGGLDRKAFIIYHPAYGYLADDYGLEMVTVEENGKEATVDRLTEIIDFARNKEIKVVFYQDEFDSSQAETIAKEIDGTAVEVSPLSYDYVNAMEDILDKLQPVLK